MRAAFMMQIIRQVGVDKSEICLQGEEGRMWRVLCLGVLLWSCSLFAQSNNATLTGRVTDPTKAVIPEAKVIAINEGTDIRHENVTDSSGNYTIPQLPPGTYRIEVEKAGFKNVARSGVVLHMLDVVAINFEMALGSAVQNVTVSSEVEAVDTTKSDISGVIAETQVRELPLNQRSFTALVTQQPGLVTMTNAAGNSQPGLSVALYSTGSQISSNGMGTSSMAYLVDGININNSGYSAPGTLAGGDIPGIEGIQEFKVLNQDYSAAYGGSAGSVVSFATRGGTNSLHGSAYEFLRNDALDAREFFNNQGKKNPYRRNQFGATLGGPIKKDKTFFFLNYEALRSRLTTTAEANVPTICARNGGVGGNLTGCPAGQTQPFPVSDVWGNPTSISPGVQALLNLYPLPSPTGIDFGNGVAQSFFPNYHPVNQQYGLVRFDQMLSNKDSLMVRYSVTDAWGVQTPIMPSYALETPGRMQGLALKWTRTVSSNLVNTLSFSFQRSVTAGATDPTVPIPAAAYTGNAARGLVGMLLIGSGASGGGVLGTGGSDSNSPLRLVRNTFPVSDDVTYVHGSHTLSFGGEFVPIQDNNSTGGFAPGVYFFSGGLNEFLAGTPEAFLIEQDGTTPSWKLRSRQFAWYVEDAWRVKRNFTLTLGLRHQFLAPIISEAHNPSRLGMFRSWDPTVAIGEAVVAPNNTLKNFGPRIGIAYDPFGDGKTAIRAGFGLFYDTNALGALYTSGAWQDPNPFVTGGVGYAGLPQFMRLLPLAQVWTILGTPFPLPPALASTPAGIDTVNALIGLQILPPTFSNLPFPSCPALPNGSSTCTSATTPAGAVVSGFMGPVRPTTSMQWNLQVERELPGKLEISGTYAGAHSYNIPRSTSDPAIPCSYVNGQPYYGAVTYQCGATGAAIENAYHPFAVANNYFDAHTFYHAGTVAVARKFASGVLFSASYTFAKAISESDLGNAGYVGIGNTGMAVSGDRKSDRSESIFSIRHRFTMNGIFELPIGKGKLFVGDASGLKQSLLGGWALNPLLEFRSGYPFSVLDGVGVSNAGESSTTLPDRPNMLRANAFQGGIQQYFDPKAYAMQDVGFLGNAPRDSVRGPGFSEVDLALTKEFQTSERTRLQFRAEAFNLINHPNFDLPANLLYTKGAQFPQLGPGVLPTPAMLASLPCNLTAQQALAYSCNPTAGVISRTVGTPRQLQFALKFIF